MSRICYSCGKRPGTGNKVSHANNRTRRRWLPNLKNIRVVTDNGTRMQVRVCTRCISAGKVRKAV